MDISRIPAKACTSCHRKKIRCDLQECDGPCSNCRAASQECRPHERKRKRDQRNTSRTPSLVNNVANTSTGYWISSSDDPLSQSRQSVDMQPSFHKPCLEMGKPSTIASPQGSYLGRAEYIGGIVPIDEDDAKMYTPHREHETQNLDMKFLQNLGVFDVPSRSMRESLFMSYMERCNPWMPIIEDGEGEGLASTSLSLLMLHAVCVAGSRTSTAPQAQSSGEIFYRKAKAIYYSGIERNPLTVIRAICILQWWNPSGPEHVSMDASSFWLHMGVGLAHQVGLHREPDRSHPEFGLRRRLWWSLYVRDCMISVSHGRPRAINLEDCDVRPPALEDFRIINEDSHLFLAYVDIASILSDIAQAAVRGSLGRPRRLLLESRLLSWIRMLPTSLHLHDRNTGSLTPYNFKIRQLHIPYFTAITILYRPTIPGSNPSVGALLSSSYVANIYEDFLARGEIPMLAPVFIFHLLASAIAQLPCHRFPTLWAKAQDELQVISQSLVEMGKRFPTALGAQRVIKHVKQAVKNEKQRSEPPQLSGAVDQLNYFEPFGQELCGKWDFVFGAGAQFTRTHPSTEAVHITTAFATKEKISSQSNDTVLTSSFAAPNDASTAFSWNQSTQVVQTNEENFLGNSGLDQQSTGLGFESVGNWMLYDWMTDPVMGMQEPIDTAPY